MSDETPLEVLDEAMLAEVREAIAYLEAALAAQETKR